MNNQTPSPLNSQPSTFIFPPSVQQDLFNYLKPEQQASLRPILRLIKRPYQEQLCVALLDYLEGNGLQPLNEPVLHQLQQSIIQICNLNPLTHEGLGVKGEGLGTSGLQHIGEVLKKILPSSLA